ncbi:hypothetical protein PG994_003118 [Apiospora phragmitis]|uniref:C2H2-type domain-containing protein n=1 Tax=Apiospora phragmitis TaxID=2905665 RepID=A0ABR1W9X0_9PEZI
MASGSNTAASDNAFLCDICQMPVKSQNALQRHRAGHDWLSCDVCGVKCSRADSVARHRFFHHGINTQHVCHFTDCHRRGYGLTTHDGLVEHLHRSHQGASLEDNTAARLTEAVPSRDDSSTAPSNGARGSDKEMTDIDDDSSGDYLGASDDYFIKSVDEYETEIFNLQEQLEEEREGHNLEIADIHEMYREKLKKLMVEATYKDMEQVWEKIKGVHDSIPL